MRKYITEFIGTFFLILTTGLMVMPGAKHAFAPLGIGLVYMTLVYAGGHVSGANYNPALSLAMFIRGRLKAAEFGLYAVAQFLAAAAAALCVSLLVSGPAEAPTPAPILPLLAVEFLFSFALGYVMLNVATSSQLSGNHFYGIAIGSTLTAGLFAGAAALNPATGLALCLMRLHTWTDSWMFLVGPMAGAALAALVFRLLNREEFFPTHVDDHHH